MAQDQELNKILKQMWLLDEKIIGGGKVDNLEKQFFNAHLLDIQKYYASNNEYWKGKISI